MPVKRILVIQGHPDPAGTHFCDALAEAYTRGAHAAGHEARTVRIAALDFPVLRSQNEWEHGALPAALAPVQADFRWAEHIVLIFPLWLGDMPALLKVFVEQVARPGFAFKPGAGGQMARSAGVGAQLMAKEADEAQVRLPSGEVRKVHINCMASVGQVGNLDHENQRWGKAGATRWRGRMPHNRGVTMNPVDHPMGGGEGRSSGGRHPCSPWGQLTKGYKTRNSKRTDGMIIKRRK